MKSRMNEPFVEYKFVFNNFSHLKMAAFLISANFSRFSSFYEITPNNFSYQTEIW